MSDGGQAFPAIDLVCDGLGTGSKGMTLRDWFAGQALAGLRVNDYEKFENAARHAYEIADAMLAERENGK